MRIVMGILVIAFLSAWSMATTVAAQCDPSSCTNPKATKAKVAKAKKAKKPADVYMKSAS